MPPWWIAWTNLSDNGGCAEFMAEDGWAKYYPDITRDGRKITMGNRADIRPGDAQTFQSYDRPWANVSNAPFRLYKHYVHEGGISTPMIAHWPAGIGPQLNTHAAAHVVDILPTILDAAGLSPLLETKYGALQPLEGQTLLPLLKGENWTRHAPIFFEHEGNAAIRLDQFKLVRKNAQPWELYDMETDRTELTNLIGKTGTLEAELIRQYQDWAKRVGVQDWSAIEPKLLKAWGLASING